MKTLQYITTLIIALLALQAGLHADKAAPDPPGEITSLADVAIWAGAAPNATPDRRQYYGTSLARQAAEIVASNSAAIAATLADENADNTDVNKALYATRESVEATWRADPEWARSIADQLRHISPSMQASWVTRLATADEVAVAVDSGNHATSPGGVQAAARRVGRPEILERHLQTLLATGETHETYRRWFSRRVGDADIAHAIEMLRNEIRAVLAMEESPERNQWLSELRASLAITRELQ